jgi:hypothetical protein
MWFLALRRTVQPRSEWTVSLDEPFWRGCVGSTTKDPS